MVPVTSTAAEEVIPAAERVPVDVRLRPCTAPDTVKDDPSIAPKEALAPSTSPETVIETPVRELVADTIDPWIRFEATMFEANKFELTPDSVVRVAHCIVVAVKIDPPTMIIFDWTLMVSAPAPMVNGEPP
jgi:hypothetical protein